MQWGTGTIGTRALRAIVDHPNLSLAGVYVHSERKAGQDAGDLCGREPVGVAATNSVEDIVGLAPDCVLYMPAAPHIDTICRLLASGSNVVTTAGLFHHPASVPEDVR